jgi:hypothetical protein
MNAKPIALHASLGKLALSPWRPTDISNAHPILHRRSKSLGRPVDELTTSKVCFFPFAKKLHKL